MSYRILSKIYYQRRFVGCEVLDTQVGYTFTVCRAQLPSMVYDNATVTKDLRVLTDVVLRSVQTAVPLRAQMVLYHGSKDGLKGVITPYHSRIVCDFGRGFYTGDNRQQALTIASEGLNPFIYDLLIDFTGLTVYTFEDPVLWMLYVAVNRGMLNIVEYPRLQNVVNQINAYDVIVGLIADDRLAYVYESFMNGSITEQALLESLRYVHLGKQFVFKTVRACDCIRILACNAIDAATVKMLQMNKRKLIGPLATQIDDVCKVNRRKGLFVDELLQRWR